MVVMLHRKCHHNAQEPADEHLHHPAHARLPLGSQHERAEAPVKILIACECSGRVRNAFSVRGHDAWSCDLKPSETPGNHIQDDVRNHLDKGWDLIIAHPDCTYLCSSGLHWNGRRPGRQGRTEEAILFAMMFEKFSPKVAVENPIGCLSSRWRKPDQIIQPYQFGDDASKSTCLWLKGLPLLKPTIFIEPRIVNGKKRWANQCDSGQNKLGPSPERAAERARTYQGIAEAMAEQWGAV